ncbi:MAG: DinB family protein [Spirochaetales bacterium]|nr:DinB family protein [Spirochaetales bacterium]
MKRALEGFADYNDMADRAMLAILDGLAPERREEPTGAYFGSLHGTVAHMAWAGALWLKRFSSFGDWSACAAWADADLAARKDGAKADWGQARALLAETDGALGLLVTQIGEAELYRRVRYATTDGTELERTLWHLVMHALNHGTHHRGEISAMLDRMGVENDFNSLVEYVE